MSTTLQNAPWVVFDPTCADESEARVLTGHYGILWLAGQVFLSRRFVQEAETHGLEVAYRACPFGDLTDGEKATFEAAFKTPELRALVEAWWEAYDAGRHSGAIPQAGNYWE